MEQEEEEEEESEGAAISSCSWSTIEATYVNELYTFLVIFSLSPSICTPTPTPVAVVITSVSEGVSMIHTLESHEKVKENQRQDEEYPQLTEDCK